MDVRLTRISITLLAFSLLLPVLSIAEETYRWKDKDGKVHFGHTIPPEYADRPYEILNSSGFVIKRVDDPLSDQTIVDVNEEVSDELAPLFTVDEIRKSTDEHLLLSYPREDDLIGAMENEIAQLGYDTRIIGTSQKSAMTSMAGHVKTAANRQRAGMPEDPKNRKNINQLRQRMARAEGELAKLKVREEKIRITFESNLKRYRYLANGGKPGSIDESEGS